MSTKRSQPSHHQKKDVDAKSHSKRKGIDHIDNDSPQQTSDEDSTADIIHVLESYKVPVELNGKHLVMELDTGAVVSLVSEKIWSKQSITITHYRVILTSSSRC